MRQQIIPGPEVFPGNTEVISRGVSHESGVIGPISPSARPWFREKMAHPEGGIWIADHIDWQPPNGCAWNEIKDEPKQPTIEL
jgi:hypothetical protein